MLIIKQFVESNIHIGHTKWNPLTAHFLLGKRDGIYVIDLEQTLIMLKRALNFIKKVSLSRGYIYYVPASPGSKGEGLQMVQVEQGGGRRIINRLTSKRNELPIMDLQVEQGNTSWIKPEVIFIMKTNENVALIKEANKLQIPLVAIIDSNTKVSYIQYPIPGSDDSNQAHEFYNEILISTLLDAKKKEAKALLSNPDR